MSNGRQSGRRALRAPRVARVLPNHEQPTTTVILQEAHNQDIKGTLNSF